MKKQIFICAALFTAILVMRGEVFADDVFIDSFGCTDTRPHGPCNSYNEGQRWTCYSQFTHFDGCKGFNCNKQATSFIYISRFWTSEHRYQCKKGKWEQLCDLGYLTTSKCMDNFIPCKECGGATFKGNFPYVTGRVSNYDTCNKTTTSGASATPAPRPTIPANATVQQPQVTGTAVCGDVADPKADFPPAAATATVASSPATF